MPNRLAEEQSPYLLQHAGNPVDWHAWGDEAVARARAEDKPIFLSVGYSTCHWCHVMAHESFEDAAIAEVLNQSFVSIKVDREERPDVDRVYMTFVQATTGSGGWPMSVWLTPELKPFFGGTYFPPSSRWGRPGFREVLEEIARVWRENRGSIALSADRLLAQLNAYASARTTGTVPGPAVLDEAVRAFAGSFDRRRGGFGEAPKFPRPSELLFLFREFARAGDETARDMALATLRAMALGGMRDHLGGGFHRYSVDADWRVPHFEKMLYDQAQLTIAYLEAAQITGESFYAEVADDTLDYVGRDMTDESGGFYSAEDADSVPPEAAGDPHTHKSEGAFYIWSADELDALLGEDAPIFKARFGIRPGGNAPFDPHGEFGTKNLLYTALTIEDVARETGADESAVGEALARARRRLFDARLTRPRPHLDDKVLTAWNGLMIAAFARAARVLGNPDHLRRAERAVRFLQTRMWDADRRILARRYRKGDAAIDGYAEDYAYTIFGLLELFQAGGDPTWLEWAVVLQERFDDLFCDEAGGWFSTTGQDPTVLLRMKEEYDGAEPTPSAIAVLNLLALSHLIGEAPAARPNQWEAKITRAFEWCASRLTEQSRALPMMLAALSTYHAGVQQLVIVGGPGAADTERLVAEARRTYLPFAVQLIVSPDTQRRVADELPFVGSMRMLGGAATAYLCRDFSCRQPVTEPDELARQLTPAKPEPRARV